MRDDDVYLEPGQLDREVGQPVEPALRKTIVDDNILVLNPPELAQPLPERVEAEIGRCPRSKVADPGHPSRLLPLGGEWRKREAECENEPDQPHARTSVGIAGGEFNRRWLRAGAGRVGRARATR
jgi:hypothetical protein